MTLASFKGAPGNCSVPTHRPLRKATLVVALLSLSMTTL
jgi:hypothetical protein